MNRIVVKTLNPDAMYTYLVVSESEIETKNYCECCDRYGQKIGCDDAGCDGDDHVRATVIEFYDGHNWNHLLLEHPHMFCEWQVVEGSEADEIVHELNNVIFSLPQDGVKKAESKRFKFFDSNWAGSIGIEVVAK